MGWQIAAKKNKRNVFPVQKLDGRDSLNQTIYFDLFARELF